VPLRSRFGPRTTPGKIRLLLIALIALCLAWGALAAFSAAGYESAAGGVVRVNEPLTLDAQHIYQDLSDANDTEATAFLTGGLEPFSLRDRYLADVRAASAATETATSMEGAATGSAAASVTSRDLLTLSTDLPVYTGEIETARADNRIGYPVGAAYLREATTLMNSSLLPAAENLYTAENAQLTATSAEATGLPLILATIVGGLVLGYVLYRTSRWLARRTNRVLNPGLVAAAVMALIALVWFAAVYGGAREDLLAARSRGAVPVAALAQADIVALQAHADESLTLIDDAGDDQYQAEYLREQKTLGPGPGTLLSAVSGASAGSPGAGSASAAVAKARAWYTAHARLRGQDDNGDHAAAVASALGTGKTDAGGQFAAFESDVSSALNADQAALRASAQAGEDMYTGLEAGIIILALLMAAACAWGLNRRLREYR
jgi:hypothetical protein